MTSSSTLALTGTRSSVWLHPPENITLSNEEGRGERSPSRRSARLGGCRFCSLFGHGTRNSVAAVSQGRRCQWKVSRGRRRNTSSRMTGGVDGPQLGPLAVTAAGALARLQAGWGCSWPSAAGRECRRGKACLVTMCAACPQALPLAEAFDPGPRPAGAQSQDRGRPAFAAAASDVTGPLAVVHPARPSAIVIVMVRCARGTDARRLAGSRG